MGHLNDMLEDKVTTVTIIEFMGDFSQLLTCLFLDIQVIEIKKLYENGDYGILDMCLVSLELFQVNDNLWDLVQKGFSDVLSVFDLL